MRQSIQDMVENDLSKFPPVKCDFKTGDTVTFTNDYGVEINCAHCGDIIESVYGVAE